MFAKCNHKLIGLVLWMFMTATAYAGGGIEWTDINDGLPNDILIDTLAVDPDSSSIIYAAASFGRVYKTINSGSSWTDITNGLDISSGKNSEQIAIALAVDSTNVYLGCGGKIFKAAKNGDSWVDITGTLTIYPYSSLSIVAQADVIYVASGHDGVYKGTNTGASWTKINNSYCFKLVAGTTTSSLYALTNSGLFIITDGGQGWGTVSSSQLNDLLVYPDVMYAVRVNSIVSSTDNGYAWGTKSSGLPSRGTITLAGHPTDSSKLYSWITTYSPAGSALYSTTNSGDIWGTVTTPSSAANAQTILVTNDAVYVAGKGIHKSADSGLTWNLINTGLPHHVNVSAMAVDPKATGTVYIANDRGIFKSTDAGNSWSAKNNGLWFNILAIDPNNSQTIYAAGNQMIYKSIDGGDSWGSITANLMQLAQSYSCINSIAIDPNNLQTIYALVDRMLCKSTTAGTSWSKIVNTPFSYCAGMFISPADASLLTYNNMWDTSSNMYNGNIYRSNDHGDTWTTIPVCSNLEGITLGTASSTIYTFGNFYKYYQYSNLARILKTTNSGGTWTQISDKKVDSLLINPDIAGVLYAHSDDGVIKSIDDGKSWGEANQGLPIINTGKLISAIAGSVGSTAFAMDPAMHNRFYLNYPPYGIYRGTDTNTAPAPPTIHTPANAAKTSDSTPLIIGSSSPGSVVLVYNGTATLLGTVATDSSGLFSLSCSNLNTGTHILKAISVDRFGTSGQTYLSLTIVPGVAPTIDSPVSGATNQATITITGTAEDGSTVVIYDNLKPIGTVTATNGFYSSTVKLVDGLHNLYAQSTNNSGVMASSDMVNLLIDTVAPMPPIITKPASGSKMPDDILTITGLTIATSTVFIYINSIEVGSVTSNESGGWTFTTQVLSDGLNEITARVKNWLGNISPSSYPVKVTIGIPPVIVSPVSGKTTKSTDIIISGKCRANASVGVYLDNANIGTATASISGTFSYTLTNLTAGTRTVTVNAVKGDKSGFSNIVTLIIQPDLPIDPVGVNISSPRGTEHPMSMDEDSSVGVHWQSTITVTVPVTGSPTRVYIKYSGTEATMSDIDNDNIYTYSFVPYPLHGNVPLTVVIEYATSGTSEVNIGTLLIDPDGHVYNIMTNGTVTGAVVTCYWFSTATTTWEIWPAWDYPFNSVPQINPQTTTTTNDCYYSFMVPAGKYYVHAVCSGYKTYQSGTLEVINDPVHHDVYMEPIPILTTLKVAPQSTVLGLSGTYSFTAIGYDQYERSMGEIECSWSSSIGSVLPANGKSIIFTAPGTVTTGIITAASGTVQGTASVIVCQPATVKLSPQAIYTRQNEVFTLNIDIADVVDLSGAKILLSFDKSKLRAGTVTIGSFFGQNDPNFLLFSAIKNPQGTVEISGTRRASSGVTGSGTIYSVTFCPMFNDCSGTISISEAVLKDVNLAVILVGDKYPAVIRGKRLLGDFGQKDNEYPDNKINFNDLMWFTKYWNDNNPKGDIASTRTTGFAPDFTYELDGRIEFEDLVYFAAMWKWDYNKGTQAPRLKSRGAIDTTAMVKLKTMNVDENKVCVDVVVENVSDLLAGHFILQFDTTKLELVTITSLADKFVKEQHGQLDISIADLNGQIAASSTIVSLTFLIKSPISDDRLPIFVASADLRSTAAKPISSYIVPISVTASDLTRVYCYPNPYISLEHTQGITFAELTDEARIRIFDIAGELVYDSGMINTRDKFGKFNWPVVNESNTPVASGIYLYLITNNKEQKKTGKVGIVR